MNYKYQRRQIFGKRLKIPKYILNRVYNCTLSFNEFFEYDLDNKIPISCIVESDRKIVEKFGIERCKELDWNLINNKSYGYRDVDFRNLLMAIDSQTENINNSLYELVKDQVAPEYYPSSMRKIYSDRLFDLSQENDDHLKDAKMKFNSGALSLKDLASNWDLFKDKDLSYCLLKDNENKNNITDNDLKQFMSSYENLLPLLIDNGDIYTFISEITLLTSETEKHEYIKHFTDDILSNTRRSNNDYRPPVKLTNDQYKEIFKYSSMEDYLKLFNLYCASKVMDELKTLPQDYVFNMPIPFTTLLDSNVLEFIRYFGLKNVVDFDNECGHFFTKNDCKMLKLMYDMYLHYAVNEGKTSIYKDKDGNYIGDGCNKEQFYGAMKKMITYGPSNRSFVNQDSDYRDITGEFRERNLELFISEDAPEELKNSFYTKSITPQLLVNNPDYIEYLNGKILSSCFESRQIQVEGINPPYNYVNLYGFLESKMNFNDVMNFITEYSDIFDIIFDRRTMDSYQYEMKFLMTDDINQIQKRIDENFKKLLIEKRLTYPKFVPQNFINRYPTLFLNNDAPRELQEAFYNRTINYDFILSNPSYKDYLKNVDLEILFEYMPVNVLNEENKYEKINLASAIRQTFDFEDSFDIMLAYGKYIASVFEINKLQHFKLNPNSSKSDLLNELDKIILRTIIDGKMKYDENIPSHFKNNNPTLFLGQNVPQDIRNKFYNREFTINDFNTNPQLLEMFESTNIACGFPQDVSWIIPLFSGLDNTKVANYNRLKVISAFLKIQDTTLQNGFKEYVMETGNNINIEKIDFALEVLSKLSLSNSNEIFTFRKELTTQILKSKNPMDSLDKVEDIFIRNNIPTVGKIYSCFEILHPDFQGFDFEISTISPVLKNSSTTGKKMIVFSDLIKSSFGSNNRSVNEYLKNIEIGTNLYESIKSKHIKPDSLTELEQKELMLFCRHLTTLYNNTMRAKKENQLFVSNGDVLTDIFELSKKLSPDGTLDYNLGDRVIKMFCGFAGINTLEQAKEYIFKKIRTADERNREASNTQMVLEQGDFIKGIGDITYLKNILQNGSVSREYLGSSAGSDRTPLDTDVSMIMNSKWTTKEKIAETAASTYGPIWFVLKNDDRFITTRHNTGVLDIKNDMSKMEAFYTGIAGQGHYGIRTGFASSEINYIVMETYDPRVGLEIAMNGFYIPVADKEGTIVFTPNDYDKLREKMSGLSYYGEVDYKFSNNLVTEETQYFANQIGQNNYEIHVKKEKINQIIKKSLNELGLQLKTNISNDLTEGFVELIDTGSTGRGTNKPGDGDFDFMMRLDRAILSDSSKLEQLKETILKNLGKENSFQLTGAGDFRLKNVQIDTDVNVDIDITFTEKTDKISYSTDMALQDRFIIIQQTDPEKYKYVVANILLAKQILKQAEVYKPNRGEIPQGGLGGVGIENWILQNGGSFIDAARSFVEASEGKKFSEFRSSYQIWDFGDNHLAERRGQYSHDNFITNNMSEIGYQKMIQVLKEYLKSIEMRQMPIEGISK